MTTPSKQSDSPLDSEYRALVRQLHEQTIAIVVEVDVWWHRVLYREVSNLTASVFDTEFDEDEVQTRQNELQDELQFGIERELLILAYGHPDPDVRRAADILQKRLFDALFYYHVARAKRKNGDSAGMAIRLAHDGVAELRRAAYHAPFRVDRPQPEYDGVGVGNGEALASQLTDVPPEEL